LNLLRLRRYLKRYATPKRAKKELKELKKRLLCSVASVAIPKKGRAYPYPCTSFK